MTDKIRQAAEDAVAHIVVEMNWKADKEDRDEMAAHVERAMRKLLAQLDEARLQINIQEVMPQPAPIAGEGELKEVGKCVRRRS